MEKVNNCVTLIYKILDSKPLVVCLYYVTFIMLTYDEFISSHFMAFMMKACWIL